MKGLRESLVTGLLAVGAVAGIAASQPVLAERTLRVKETTDSYALPPTEQLDLATLGYRAAAADVIWAYVLVSQGLHFSEHRKFEWGARYFEAVNHLDPTFRDPYLFADAILTFGAIKPNADDARAARRILETGLRVRPFDAALYRNAGSFLAYLADAYISDPKERDEWTSTGALYLARAGELGEKDGQSVRESLVSANILSRAGQADAAASILERALVATDNEAAREEILPRLRKLRGEQYAEQARDEVRKFEVTWRNTLPFVSRTTLVLVGPEARPWGCVGSSLADVSPKCRRTWQRTP